jgi:hypothetical protein
MDAEVFSFLLHQVEAKKLAYHAARGTRPDDPMAGFSRAERLALDAYAEAMARLNRYLLDGTIPDDLRKKMENE